MSNTLKVIGTGLPRTGTNSLRLVLNQLGKKCFHGYDFVNDYSLNINNAQSFWNDVKSVAGQNINWDNYFKPLDYSSCCDTPTLYYWKELYHYYPNSKVIITKRDENKWFKSFQFLFSLYNNENKQDIQIGYDFVKQMHKDILFDGCDVKYSDNDRDLCIEIFDNFYTNVINCFTDDNLSNKLMLIDLDDMDSTEIMIIEI